MSLQLVANHLAQKGRGPDSTLVHMSNREVAGLNALAQKHGGQLSVNPDTGLPEAGFLDNLLPMVAGAGLTYFSGGAINPLMAGGIIGGITALDSKDLSKGLVAGLGAYGGSGMVGGLAGLGAEAAYMPGAAGEAARVAGTEAAIANGTYQSQVGTGLGNFIDQPMTSLSTLGGGSAIKGSLPILAGLAPAAAEAFDEEDEDKPPEQHKGYIRKYALDPVTGQYKQVGVYEAGGDPNVDVTAKAGTAGSYGGVGQSEYEAAQGMAEGGTTDSSRIYDYLMGRGPNPMQFTRASSPQTNSPPQVDYNAYMPKPITPTTPILEDVYDPYGNRVHEGGNYDPERRKAELAERNDYLSVDGNDISLGQFFDLRDKDPEAAKALEKRAAEVNPIRYTIGEVVKLAAPGRFVMEGLDAFGNAIKGMFPTPVALQDIPLSYDPQGNIRYNPVTRYPMLPDEAARAQLGEQITVTNAEKNATYSPPQGDPAQQAAVRDAINKTDFSGMDRGSTSNAPAAPQGAGAAPPGGPPSGGGGGGGGRSGDGGDGGSGGFSRGYGSQGQHAATGGLATPYGMEHMAQGGIANLAQGYDSGGMTLPLKAQPIKNLGSMHPKALQAAYDRAVSTNDVAGARKYQNELGLREKFKNPQMYADGGETGEYNLGSYSDGGRLLKGPGDGVSDSIPATIGRGQPARLADGEFVIPARIVSELGNGSTDAGARALYKMMARIQAGRRKTVGKKQVAKNSKSARHLPA